MTFELPKPDKWCHHTGFSKKCCDLVTSQKCKRWRNLPGEDVFTGLAREQWGCIDDLVLQLQGESNRENRGTHAAMTNFREMIFNPEYRRRQLGAKDDTKLIEGKKT